MPKRRPDLDRMSDLEREAYGQECIRCQSEPREALGRLRCNCPDPWTPALTKRTPHVAERTWKMVRTAIEHRPEDLPRVTKQDVKGLVAPNATDTEVELFVRFCLKEQLNPFIREAHLVKYENQPAFIQVDYKVLFKRALRDPDYDRYTAGITVADADGVVERRTGSLVLPKETLLGGWCKVHMTGEDEPIEAEVGFAEFVQHKRDGSVTSFWAKKPGFMIEKVAITTAFRRAIKDVELLMDSAAELRVEAAEIERPAVEAPGRETLSAESEAVPGGMDGDMPPPDYDEAQGTLEG